MEQASITFYDTKPISFIPGETNDTRPSEALISYSAAGPEFNTFQTYPFKLDKDNCNQPRGRSITLDKNSLEISPITKADSTRHDGEEHTGVELAYGNQVDPEYRIKNQVRLNPTVAKTLMPECADCISKTCSMKTILQILPTNNV